MTKKNLLLTLLATTLLLGACSAPEDEQATQKQAFKLPALFLGELPCADCAGIHYELSLYPDHAYGLELTYLGEPDKHARFFESGTWSIADDSDTLTLNPVNSDRDTQWQVVDGETLKGLSADGEPIQSGLDYTLHRSGTPITRPLENTYWKLIRLHGKSVTPGIYVRDPHFVLHPEKARVAGSDGCNLLMGSYQHDHDTLRFSKLASTLMACPKQSMEAAQVFSKMLGKIRTYRLYGNYLVAHDAEGNAIAVFRATAMQ